MTALTADRNTHQRAGELFEYPWAASEEFFAGALAVLNSSGTLEAATAATSKITVGRVEEYTLATAVASAAKVKVRTGCFKFANSVGDAIAAADIGAVCYIEDDQTVCKTLGSNSVAGYIKQVDTDGVWVDIHGPSAANPSLALLIANNLSDVNTAATARANIGANLIPIGPLKLDNIVSATAKVYRMVSPIAGDITAIRTILCDHALAAGDVTITGSIGAVAITDGVVTIAESGSAAGDIDLASPSAANTVAVGDEIRLTVGGTNTDTDAYAELTLLIET